MQGSYIGSDYRKALEQPTAYTNHAVRVNQLQSCSLVFCALLCPSDIKTSACYKVLCI